MKVFRVIDIKKLYFFDLTLINYKEISNFIVDENFSWLAITYIILPKYLISVCLLPKTDNFFDKINIYFYFNIIKYISYVCYEKSILTILLHLVYLSKHVWKK